MLASGKRSKFSITSLFLDVMTTLTVMFAALLGVVLNVAQIDVKKAQDEAVSLAIGNISVEARWADNVDVDIDLWVKAPDDRHGVGYSRRGDIQSSYVRDDLGDANDPGDLNFENVFIRGVRPGRYIVNLHFYQTKGFEGPVEVKVRANLLPSRVMSGRDLATATVILNETGQETTAFSFELDDKGNIVEGSLSKEFLPIRGQGAL